MSGAVGCSFLHQDITTIGLAVYLFRLVPGQNEVGAVFHGFQDAITKHQEAITAFHDAEHHLSDLESLLERSDTEEKEAAAKLEFRQKQVEEDDAEVYKLLTKDYDRLKFDQDKNNRPPLPEIKGHKDIKVQVGIYIAREFRQKQVEEGDAD